MNSWSPLARAILAAALGLAGLEAAAQAVYRCGSGQSTYLSDRPCGEGAPRGRLGVIGGAPQQAPTLSSSTYMPRAARASDFLPYLGAECQQMSEAIRTGPARGVRADTLADLHRDYQRRCSEDERQAREEWSRDQRLQRDARQSAQLAQKAAQDRSALERDQCYEMLRILHGKRQRAAGMNEGEKADLQRAEQTYKARCSAG
ncbi:hypothetical protein [Rivibacter subsaxonicus]|uniref:DUF4124 domain-containing protein n=1 Tax=Rivibacter subsaxonicus TaxID=457575 RepID=A0A4V2FU99_9BURK|nr:hypothetical protein [Rivibacter subsaxonicus]RZU01236.1 hypothetical protein EV670_1952 [Rivibacter subsaxonicus]